MQEIRKVFVMTKILSLIIPTYNMEKYLDRCLSSLIVEDDLMSELEVLVINDGSMDRSSEIAHGYANRYPDTFVVIDKENGHYGSCVNAGLKLATGKYVKILDADDWFITDEFCKYIQDLSIVDVDIVLSRYVVLNEGKTWESPKYQLSEKTGISIGDLPEEILDNAHQAISYRTDLLRSLNYVQTEGIPYSDVEWCVFPMSKVSSFSYFSGILYSYDREREGQSMASDVRLKNLGVNCDVALRTVDYYERNKDYIPSKNKRLLFAISSLEIKNLYKCILLYYRKKISDDFIKSFDARLESTSKEIYQYVESAHERRKFGTIYYIRQWRKRGSRNTLAFVYYDLGMKLGKILSSLR